MRLRACSAEPVSQVSKSLGSTTTTLVRRQLGVGPVHAPHQPIGVALTVSMVQLSTISPVAQSVRVFQSPARPKGAPSVRRNRHQTFLPPSQLGSRNEPAGRDQTALAARPGSAVGRLGSDRLGASVVGHDARRRSSFAGCRRRFKSEPPRRSNIEPGVEADFEIVGCG